MRRWRDLLPGRRNSSSQRRSSRSVSTCLRQQSWWSSTPNALALHSCISFAAASDAAAKRQHACCSTRPHLAKRRSEEHTSELQSLRQLVCRVLLDKKKG